MNYRKSEFLLVGIVALILAIVFISFPKLDLMASGSFFREGAWLLDRDSPWLYPIYVGLPRLGQLLAVLVGMLLLLSILDRHGKFRDMRSVLVFLLAGILVGPVLVVDVGLKDHSGRARPINVQTFGGTKEFSPAFIPAHQCIKNCSFVSGHVVGASFIMAFGWLGTPTIRRRWLLGSLGFAGAVGIARMLPGGHFLSDVVFAWLFVYFSLWFTEGLLSILGWHRPEQQGN